MLVVPYRFPASSKITPATGPSPSAQLWAEQKRCNTFSLAAADNGVVMARDPTMTLNTATHAARFFLLGMDASSGAKASILAVSGARHDTPIPLPSGASRQSLSGADLTKPVMQLVGLRKQVVGYLAPVIGTKVR